MTFRLLTYLRGTSPRAGLLVDGRVYDAAQVTSGQLPDSVLAALQAWDRTQPGFVAAAASLRADPLSFPSIPVEQIMLAAPILWPGAIYAAGANYLDHVQEMNRAHGFGDVPTLKDLGEAPWHCLKAGRSCVVGPGATIVLPPHTDAVDWELELAAVIGRVAYCTPAEQALDYVAGYTIANDLSSRDTLKRARTPASSPFHADWFSCKNFDGACPIGPWITPALEIEDPQTLDMKLWVGDELMQESNTSKMIFSVAEQIAALSSRVTLQPGDLILTGTPAGVGMPRKRFLRPGETVRLWIEGLGEFSHQMVEARSQ